MTILLTPFHDIINLSEIYETEPLIYEKTKTFMDDLKTYKSNPDSFRLYRISLCIRSHHSAGRA